MSKVNSRWFYIFLFFICHELLVAAFYFEYVEFMEPCPLCMISRLMVFLIGVTCLIAAIHNPVQLAKKIYHGFISLFALLGTATSIWHLRLQNLPADEVPECGPGLTYMLETMPLGDVLGKVLQGSGECAEVSWRFLSLSMPAWMLVIYVCFLLIGLYPLFKRERHMRFKDD